MDPQHPIPQNVTAFEFHLVGNMTLKQFGYLAAGLIIAYFTYVIIFPVSWFIATPIIFFSSLTGAAFAFLPILDRPLEHWVAAYIKAVYSTSEGRWKDLSDPKKKVDSSDSVFKNRLANFLSRTQPLLETKNPIISVPKIAPAVVFPSPKKLDLSKIPSAGQPQNTPKISQIPSPSFNPFNLPLAQEPIHTGKTVEETKTPEAKPPKIPSLPDINYTSTSMRPTDLPSQEELNKLIAVAKQAHLLQTRIVEIEKELTLLKTGSLNQENPALKPIVTSPPILSAAPILPVQPPRLKPGDQPKFQQMVTNLQNLVKETEELHRQSEVITDGLPHPSSQKVVIVKPEVPTQQVPTLTSFPNVINGIVVDITGSYLDGVIVIIHNKTGLPVRALKTNKLGQFAGATPLADGIYTITLEREALEFDTLQITLEGKVLPPLIIQPKRGGAK